MRSRCACSSGLHHFKSSQVLSKNDELIIAHPRFTDAKCLRMALLDHAGHVPTLKLNVPNLIQSSSTGWVQLAKVRFFNLNCFSEMLNGQVHFVDVAVHVSNVAVHNAEAVMRSTQGSLFNSSSLQTVNITSLLLSHLQVLPALQSHEGEPLDPISFHGESALLQDRLALFEIFCHVLVPPLDPSFFSTTTI